MSMYNLTEYSDIYSKRSGSLWQYYGDEPALNNAGGIIDFPAENNCSVLFEFKAKVTSQTGHDGTRGDEIMLRLK